jgi:hypothetical protein
VSVATAVAKVANWEPMTRILEVINIKGKFTNNVNVTGTDSNTSKRLLNYDELKDHVQFDEFDNRKIQDEAEEFVDLSETNPFGMP